MSEHPPAESAEPAGGAPPEAGEPESANPSEPRPPGGADEPTEVELGRPTFEAGELRTGTRVDMESVRAQVARALVALLAVVVLFAFLTLWLVTPPPAMGDLEKLLTIVFGPLVALVSGAVGYYFGGKSVESEGGGE